MIKNILCSLFLFMTIFTARAFANENQVLNNAFNKFSVSPFSTLFIEGGAFFFGDGLNEMPLTIRYAYNKKNNSKRMDAIDGLFGSLMFDIKINKNILDAYVVEWQTNFTADINTVTVDVPIISNPKIYSDVLSYQFIDTSKTIINKSIELGKNWNTLTIDYRDRVDTIIFSAKSMRVRTYTSEYYNNKITIDMSAYTNINGVDYPMSFILKSESDKREIRLSLTTIVDNYSKVPRLSSDFLNY